MARGLATIKKAYRAMISLPRLLVEYRNALYDIDKRIGEASTLIKEIASFANDAKNGRNYLRTDGVVLTTVFSGQIIAVDPDDISLAPHLILSGEWEMELSRRCEEIVRRRESPVIFDIGANFGWYGLILSRFSQNSNVHFFEANPELIGMLQKTTLVNGIALRSKVNNHAVAASSGQEVILSVPKMHKGSASIAGINESLELFHEQPELVEESRVITISIDDYCSLHSIGSICFMKIDTEGAEAEVLFGARRTIENSADLSIMMEWNRRCYPNSILELLRLFARCEALAQSGNFIDLSAILHMASNIQEFESDTFRLCESTGTHLDLFFHKN